MYTNDSTWNNVHSTSTCNKMDLLQCQALKSSRNFWSETLLPTTLNILQNQICIHEPFKTIFNHTECLIKMLQ